MQFALLAAPSTTRPAWRRPRQLAARLLLLAPLAAASAQAASSYAVSYFVLPGSGTTILWDIDNQGRLVGEAAGDINGNGYRSFLIENGLASTLVAPNGSLAISVGLSETGVVVGAHDDPTRTYSGVNDVFDPVTGDQLPQPFVANVQVGFIRSASGQWQTVEPPLTGLQTTLVRSVSPNGRYVAGYAFTDTLGTTFFQRDTLTGTTSLVPGSVQPFILSAVDNEGRLIGSDMRRKPLIYDPLTGASTNLSDQGYQRLSPRAVNSAGLMSGWLLQSSPGGDAQQLAWVGTADGITVLPTRPGSANALGMNDLGQVVGAWTSPDGSQQQGFIATPVAMPVDNGAAGSFSFSVAVQADMPVFIDPLVAVGYVYAVGSGDPLFKTVSLPVGIGDGRYTLHVGGLVLEVGGNQVVDFTALGFAQGVAGFSVTGIETAAALDPSDNNAFVTRLTFMADGRFTGTQTPISVDVPAVPEPATAALWLLGLGGLLARRRQATA